MMLRTAWYLAGWSFELGRRPLGRRILGEDLVLFRDEGGRAHALSARCPHRGADLSRGRVREGCVECPFHGWRFDPTGQCVRVPSQPEHVKIPPLARVSRYPLEERQGILWIYMRQDEEPRFQSPQYDFLDASPRARRISLTPILLEVPFPRLVENVLDIAHIPWVHRRSFGSGTPALVQRRRIVEDPDGRGILGQPDPTSPWKPDGRFVSGFLRYVAPLIGYAEPVSSSFKFELGGVVHASYHYPNGTWDVILFGQTPADDTYTWVFIESVRTRAVNPLGDLVQRIWLRSFLAEARYESSILLDRGYDASGQTPSASVESDKLGLVFQRLYRRCLRAEVGSGDTS